MSDDANALAAIARLYHAFQTGLMLTVSLKRGPTDAAKWTRALFRRQHKAKFLSSFAKLGLTDLPDAQAAAAYHYLSNRVGGVDVEYVAESETKAWVRFPPPRWIYPGAAICGIPSEVSRAMLEGWYQENGPSLGNPRLGFVCTAQTTDGQHGLAGYFQEFDRDLAPEERLTFRPGEDPPIYDEAAAPKLPAAEWPPERLAKANRNYAMEYARTGLPLLTELFGPSDGGHLGRHTGRLIGAQGYRDLVEGFGLSPYQDGAAGFAQLLARMAEAEGDSAVVGGGGDDCRVIRTGWRLGRGMDMPHRAVFDAWSGLIEGLAAAHDRFLAVEILARPDHGDTHIEWRVRRRA
ncbi:MAG: hypothetical protein ACKVH0_16115 [Alphaproteobacteria bacterium]